MNEVALTSLLLPVIVSTIALFMWGALSHMMLPVHKPDWSELPDEEAFRSAVGGMKIPPGNYMVPYCADTEQMQSEEFMQKMKEGPTGIIRVWNDPGGMGKQLGCQFIFLLVTSFCLGYLATLGPRAGADFMTVFRFVGTAAILAYTVAIVPNSIWFKSRLTGFVIDGVVCGLLTGLIFALFWPEASAGA